MKKSVLIFLVSTSAYAADPRSFMPVKITSQDALTDADVTNTGGKNRLEVNASQSGTWTAGRTWTLLNTTDSVNAVQSGTWTAGRTWVLSSGTDSVAAAQSGVWNITNITGTVSLPTGASTAANQSSQISLLTAIDAGIPVALGSTVSANSMPVVLPTDQNVNVTSVGGMKVSYAASLSGLVSGTTATDIFTITGSATKIIKIKEIGFSITGGGGVNVNILVLKRSTANAGGTFTTISNVANDSVNGSGTAVARAYTSNPTTLGTLVGTLRAIKVFAAGASTAAAGAFIEEFGDSFTQPIILRGVNEVLAINLLGLTISAANINVWIDWSEE